MNLKDYEFYNDPNGKTRALWEKIKEELKKTLPEYVEITLQNWKSVAINKESNEDGIEEKIRQFAEGFKSKQPSGKFRKGNQK